MGNLRRGCNLWKGGFCVCITVEHVLNCERDPKWSCEELMTGILYAAMLPRVCAVEGEGSHRTFHMRYGGVIGTVQLVQLQESIQNNTDGEQTALKPKPTGGQEKARYIVAAG